MRITKWGEYGIHCAVYIAAKDASTDPLITAQEIADSQSIPVDYARQILQRLKNGNIVQTHRGPQGGYILARPPEEITLADILRAAEGETFEIICEAKPINDERCADTSLCNIRPIWHKLHDHIEGFLKSYTLKQIADMQCGTPSSGGCNGSEKPVQIGG